MTIRSIAAITGFVAFAGSAAAAVAQPVPSYARTDEAVRGTISRVDGRTVYVRDERGFVDKIALHDGTVINPTGLRLSPGQSVTVHGATNGPVFDAAEIDTPYHRDYAYAPYAYYPGPYAYGPYGYGYGYGPYAYGPAFGLRLGFRFR